MIERKWYHDWKERLESNLSGRSTKPWKPLYEAPPNELEQERRILAAVAKRERKGRKSC